MDGAKAQLVQKLQTASNVLVTVSRDPSVDQLSALLGLALVLNKQGKHCAAVFSGQIPSTLEFLKPEETIEKNTDSLRDFIIALDKSKADKLRYKVEDDIVRIYITPYKTSISEADLDFSQGDFNVDVVVALGVHEQADLDEAITAHGRILHDAVVTSINVTADGGLGSINWHEPSASSLSELVTELAQALNNSLIDEQIATALLTGIVSATDRFSNDKTSSQTMSISSVLMAAGANQQLVATKLEEPLVEPKAEETEPPDSGEAKTDGTLEIDHAHDASKTDEPVEPELELPAPDDGPDEEAEAPEEPGVSSGSKLVTEPPTLGGTLSANISPSDIEPSTDPLSLPQEEAPELLDHKPDTIPPVDTPSPAPPVDNSAPPPTDNLTPPPPDWSPPPPPAPTSDSSTSASDTPQVQIDQDGTLSQLEKAVNSPHVESSLPPAPDTESARDEVSRAINAEAASTPPPPIAALNAQPLGPELHPPEPMPSDDQAEPPLPPADNSTSAGPPPVPPPIPFEFGKPSN